jgi:hypothetical protein
MVQTENVILEVTETALASDVDGGIAKLNSLKSLGVSLAIDDFGTGFSSLSTLASLPIDIFKIDRAFVSGNASGAPSVPMLEGILGLAQKLSLAVIAEGIEELLIAGGLLPPASRPLVESAAFQFQLSILTSPGSGKPVPVSSSDLRLIRKTAHLVLQWCMNSTGSFQP